MDSTIGPYILIGILLIIAIAEFFIIVIAIKKAKEANITEDDVISLVNEGQEDGNILASEAEMIQNIFEFSDTDAKDIMTHRKNIIAMDGNITVKEAFDFVIANHFSRYPVFLDEFDNIIGILHIKDLLPYYQDPAINNTLIKDFQGLDRQVEFVPETHGINTLFAKMQNKKRHMIIVLDEYGQVSGIISLEDILEEIVGNILDEHDDEDKSIEVKDENEIIMDGSTPLDEADDILGVHLSEDFETLNGYLISLLGRIPEDGSHFTLEDDNFTYEIKDVTDKVIDSVVVKRKNHKNLAETSAVD